MRTVLAPAKVNLCLYLGETRASDGKHELLTVFDALSLADELTVEFGVGADEVICPGVEGPNLAARALAMLREAGWSAPPARVLIDKHIPVAAGMGGGSADAAAVLALARETNGDGAIDLVAIAQRLGADVAAMIEPGLWLGTGAGDDLVQIGPELEPHAYVIVPSNTGLSTPAVYREADRMGLPRTAEQLEILRLRVLRALGNGGRFPAQLTVNDLQPAALSLCPAIEPALAALVEAGADEAMVSGSGPTTVGIWWGDDALERAETALKTVCERFPAARIALPWAGPSQSTSIP